MNKDIVRLHNSIIHISHIQVSIYLHIYILRARECSNIL